MERVLRADFLRLMSLKTTASGSVAKDPALDGAEECLLTRYSDLENLRGSGGTLYGTGSRELLILAGEAAVHLENYDVATKALEAFYEQGSCSDQFLCRAYFLDAVLRSQEANKFFGAKAFEKRMGAIEKVLSAIAVAVERKEKYGFIVYNASVQFWGIVRPMLRKGRRQHVAGAFKTVLSALDSVADRDIEWRMRLSLQCALCQIDAGDSSDAIKTIEASLAMGRAEIAREDPDVDEGVRKSVERAVAEAESVLVHACSANNSRLNELSGKAKASANYASLIE